MKKIIVASFIFTFALIAVTASLVSFKAEYAKTLVFVSNNPIVIKSQIDAFCKYGYKVHSVTPQSVSISSGGNRGQIYDVKGDIILVLTK